MKIGRFADFWKNTVSKTLKIFTISFIITFIIGSYILVLALGYVKGREDLKLEFLNYFQDQGETASPSLTPTQSPKVSPTKMISKKNKHHQSLGRIGVMVCS